MPNIRRDVWKLPPGDTTLEWYGKAVGVLQSRPITDVTSWWSLAAIHGIDQPLWEKLKVIEPGAALPSRDVQEALWNQCQHQTWYFLPWHRGYLSAFERIVRDAVTSLGGPEDWALPYWNYSNDAASRELPRAFMRPTLPDGSRNFLHVARRYGIAEVPAVQDPLIVDPRVVAVAQTLREPYFEGPPGDGPSGFGGIKTPFWHGERAGTFGVLESQPHGGIHVFVGGGFKSGQLSRDPADWGYMTNPDTAALDPIFWLHHANIDRLWNVWLRQKPRRNSPPETFKNPTDLDWLDGPRDAAFAVPGPDGKVTKFTAREMLDTRGPWLDYTYDDDAPAEVDHVALRMERLGADPALASEIAGRIVMSPPKAAELIGASGSVSLGQDVVEASVRLDRGQRAKLTETREMNRFTAEAPRAPDRVFLNLEDIKSPSDAALFYVYVDLPHGADPEENVDRFAGTLSMFGVSRASSPQGPNAGNGVNASFDITHIVDELHARNALRDTLAVKLVSAVPGATSADISIGRISVYRQEQ